MRLRLILSVLGLLWLVLSKQTYAGPILQLYLEGATYDAATESWTIAQPGPSEGAAFRLWAIGNVAGPGGKGTIKDVRISAVYDAAAGNPQILFTPSTTTGYGGYLDPSTPTMPVYLQTRTDGETPMLGDRKRLSRHGEYGAGKVWQEFSLGDFSLTDSAWGDFTGSFPPLAHFNSAQINVYEVSLINDQRGPLKIHFDVYNAIEDGSHVKVASSGGTVIVMPGPPSLVIWTLLGLCLTFGRKSWKRLFRDSWPSFAFAGKVDLNGLSNSGPAKSRFSSNGAFANGRGGQAGGNGHIATRKASNGTASPAKAGSLNCPQSGNGHALPTDAQVNGSLDGPAADRRLVDRCLAGDDQAWQELFAQQHHRLLASIRSMFGRSVNDPNRVEEIAACLWYELVADKGELLNQFDVDQGCRLSTYLSALAKSTAVEIFRADKRRRRREVQVSQPELGGSLETEDQSNHRISTFLDRLTPRERGFCVEVLLNGTDSAGLYSPTNDWQLRSRIRRKLREFARESA
jgi:DNA-directed RNA polymerase specialized sigma24 family protein